MKKILTLIRTVIFRKQSENKDNMTPFETFKNKEKFNEDLESYYPGAASRKVKKQLT